MSIKGRLRRCPMWMKETLTHALRFCIHNRPVLKIRHYFQPFFGWSFMISDIKDMFVGKQLCVSLSAIVFHFISVQFFSSVVYYLLISAQNAEATLQELKKKKAKKVLSCLIPNISIDCFVSFALLLCNCFIALLSYLYNLLSGIY